MRAGRKSQQHPLVVVATIVALWNAMPALLAALVGFVVIPRFIRAIGGKA